MSYLLVMNMKMMLVYYHRHRHRPTPINQFGYVIIVSRVIQV